jgi:sigma-B regulation protein RsbU (phosphoserine phosphatase)
MALTRSLLRAEATRGSSPRRVLERVNRLLQDMNDAGMFVTVLYGILDAEQSTFSYARAGHELPLLIRADGSAELADSGVGTPLGLFDDVLLDEQVIHLSPRDMLLLYTDGATDITDASETLYGMERLQETACLGARQNSAQALCDEIGRDLLIYRGATSQADDVALVAIRVS